MLADGLGKSRFAAVVDLVVQVGAHGGQPIVHIAAGGQPARQLEHAHHGIEVAVYHLGKARVLDLAGNDVTAGANPAAVHLGQRGSGKGLLRDVEVGEPGSQVRLQHRGNGRPGQRFGLATQLVQGLGQHRRQEMLAQQGKDLPDLHVGALEATQFRHEAARLAAGKL